MMEPLTRRGLRHEILRKRNLRVAELRDDRPPLALRMSHETWDELRTDGDPAELWTMSFDGDEFMGIPILAGDWPLLGLGEVQIDWPAPKETP